MTRLMCSKDRTEVEFIKKELFRAGIRSEIRSNPVAAALRVNRLELWVQDERDYLTASKLFEALQSRDHQRQAAVEAAPVAALPPAELRAKVEVEDPDPPARGSQGGKPGPDLDAAAAAVVDEPSVGDEDIEQASVWLEKEIEELLARESKLTEDCAVLQQEVRSLKESLGQAQAQVTKEAESRAAAEKRAAEFAALRASLESDLAQRSRAEEQLQRQMKELQAQARPREEALAAAQAKLEAKTRELQSQQSSLAKLHTEMASREAQTEKLRENLAQLRTEVAQERERRIAAEEKADKLASRQTALEEQLVHHSRLHQELQRELQEEQKQMRGYASALSGLRQKLQAGRVGRAGPDASRAG